MLEIQEMMNGFFGYFQIVGLALLLFLLVARTLRLTRTANVFAITLTIRKGLQGFLEIILFLIVIVWSVEVFLYALQLEVRLFPYPLNINLIDMLSVKIAGAALVVLGFAFFISALITLGNAWRSGIDEKKPGRLTTEGIYSLSRNPSRYMVNPGRGL